MILIFTLCVHLFKVTMSGGSSIWGCAPDTSSPCAVDGPGRGNVVLQKKYFFKTSPYVSQTAVIQQMNKILWNMFEI